MKARNTISNWALKLISKQWSLHKVLSGQWIRTEIWFGIWTEGSAWVCFPTSVFLTFWCLREIGFAPSESWHPLVSVQTKGHTPVHTGWRSGDLVTWIQKRWPHFMWTNLYRAPMSKRKDISPLAEGWMCHRPVMDSGCICELSPSPKFSELKQLLHFLQALRISPSMMHEDAIFFWTMKDSLKTGSLLHFMVNLNILCLFSQEPARDKKCLKFSWHSRLGSRLSETIKPHVTFIQDFQWH